MTQEASDHLSDAPRAPAVTIADVLGACRELEAGGEAVTRRSVRHRLGRGSMTTVHNGVTEYERQRAPAPPRIDLTASDREVISDLGARALAVAEERVQRLLVERDAAFEAQIKAAEARSSDAMAAAEAMIEDAERRAREAIEAAEHRVREAVAAKEAAEARRDEAVSATAEAGREMLRLDGQMREIQADKASLAAGIAAAARELAAGETQLALERAARHQAEAAHGTITTAMATLRIESEAKLQQSVEALSKTGERLAAQQARLDEVSFQRDFALETLARRDAELERAGADRAVLAANLEASAATITDRDRQLDRLAAELDREQARGRTLATSFEELGLLKEQLRSLEAAIRLPPAEIAALTDDAVPISTEDLRPDGRAKP